MGGTAEVITAFVPYSGRRLLFLFRYVIFGTQERFIHWLNEIYNDVNF